MRNSLTASFSPKNVSYKMCPDASYRGHDMSGVEISLSFHRKWISSAAKDGSLMVRLVENPVSARE